AAWGMAVGRDHGPTMLVLSRQKLPVLSDNELAAEGVLKGAYILARETKESPDIVLIASGSEVHLVLAARKELRDRGVDARVVSMPCWELFEAQSQTYRDAVFPPDDTPRLAVEAGASFGWSRWVGDVENVIGVDRFGSSAPGKENFQHYGLTVDAIVHASMTRVG
ncbi:MAG: transketolase C-terminal domain-containing protein, partial [bacterium]